MVSSFLQNPGSRRDQAFGNKTMDRMMQMFMQEMPQEEPAAEDQNQPGQPVPPPWTSEGRRPMAQFYMHFSF